MRLGRNNKGGREIFTLFCLMEVSINIMGNPVSLRLMGTTVNGGLRLYGEYGNIIIPRQQVNIFLAHPEIDWYPYEKKGKNGEVIVFLN